MTRLRFLFFALVLSLCVQGQYDFKIPRAEQVKTGHKVFPGNFIIDRLPWGALNSECFSEPVKEGTWMELRPKGTQVTFRVVTGKKIGNLKAPIIYIGKVVEDKQGRKLEEVACQKFEPNAEQRYSISLKDIPPKASYFVLVAPSVPTAPKSTFAIEVTNEYIAPPKVQVLAEVPTQTISGRVTDGQTGRGVANRKVDLLGENMQIINSTQTNQKGDFRFEKLPLDQVYLTSIDAYEPTLDVDVFLFPGEGKPAKRGSQVAEGVFGFPTLNDAFMQLVLLQDDDWQLDPQKGTVGITGRIVDAQTLLEGFANISVGLYDKSKHQVDRAVTDGSGRFVFNNRNPAEFLVRYEEKPKKSFSEIVMVDDRNVPFMFSNSRMMDSEGYFQFEELPREIVEMKRMEVAEPVLSMPSDFSEMDEGKPIVLKNILFKPGSFELLPSSYPELDALAEALQAKPDVRIDISGHTDNTGNEATNAALSLSRAEGVSKYLSSKGIERSRLIATGHGSKKPIASNDTEEGRKQNRRVEFVVVK